MWWALALSISTHCFSRPEAAATAAFIIISGSKYAGGKYYFVYFHTHRELSDSIRPFLEVRAVLKPVRASNRVEEYTYEDMCLSRPNNNFRRMAFMNFIKFVDRRILRPFSCGLFSQVYLAKQACYRYCCVNVWGGRASNW